MGFRSERAAAGLGPSGLTPLWVDSHPKDFCRDCTEFDRRACVLILTQRTFVETAQNLTAEPST